MSARWNLSSRKRTSVCDKNPSNKRYRLQMSSFILVSYSAHLWFWECNKALGSSITRYRCFRMWKRARSSNKPVWRVTRRLSFWGGWQPRATSPKCCHVSQKRCISAVMGSRTLRTLSARAIMSIVMTAISYFLRRSLGRVSLFLQNNCAS